MKVNFTDTFTKSLEKMYWQNTLPYKVYSFFRYDAPRFIKNVWKFRKALYNHYWFDNHGTLMFMEIGFTDMANKIEKYGIEVDGSRMKKVEKMRRAAQLIKNYNEDLYIEMAEKELGELIMRDWEFETSKDHPNCYELVDNETPEEKEHNRRVFDRTREIGEQEWTELFDILKGQDYSTFDDSIDFDEQFDGSGIRGWWD